MAAGCSKTFLVLLNSVLIVFGVALIVLSFYVYKKYDSIQVIIGIIVLAFCVLFIGLLGLIGALQRSRCALSIYIILAGLITLVLAVTLILLCVKQDWLIAKVVKNYEEYAHNPRLLNDETAVKVARDFFAQMKCCGFKEKNAPTKIFDHIDFCADQKQSRPLCDQKLKDDLHRNLVAIIVVHAILTGLSALACLLALHLICAVDNRMQYPTFPIRYR